METWDKVRIRSDEKKSKYAWFSKQKWRNKEKKRFTNKNKTMAKLTIFDCTIWPVFVRFFYIGAGLIAQSNPTDTHTHTNKRHVVNIFRVVLLFLALVFYRIQFDFCNIFAMLINCRRLCFCFYFVQHCRKQSSISNAGPALVWLRPFFWFVDSFVCTIVQLISFVICTVVEII